MARSPAAGPSSCTSAGQAAPGDRGDGVEREPVARRRSARPPRGASSVPGSSDLVHRHDLRPRGQLLGVGAQLVLDRVVVGEGIAAGRRDRGRSGARAGGCARCGAGTGCPSPLPSAAPGMSPGRSAITKLRSSSGAHDAEARLERGERVVGDLGLGRGEARHQRGLARVREAHHAHVGQQLQLEVDPVLLAGPAEVRAARGPVGGGGEAGVAAPAAGARGPPRRRWPALGQVPERLAGRRARRRWCRAGTRSTVSSPLRPCLLEPCPWVPRSAV